MVAPSNAATKCTSHLIPVSSSDVFDDSAFQGAFLSVDTSSSPQALINDRQSSFLYLVTQGADQFTAFEYLLEEEQAAKYNGKHHHFLLLLLLLLRSTVIQRIVFRRALLAF
jgi:hypothetical protein